MHLSSNIIEYTSEFKPYMIQALMELQSTEFNLSDTRKAPSIEVCEEYLSTLLNYIKTQNGKIFLYLQNDVFAGFVSYYFEKTDIIFEEKDSNIYAYLSDLCVLKEFRNQGIAGLLLDKVFDYLKATNFVGRVRVNSLTNNVASLKTYEKYGFKPYEITYERYIT